MDFLLWATKSLHFFSMVVWLGGLMYQAVVTVPGLVAEETRDAGMAFMLRFLPYLWMCVWTMAVTGVALMLFSPRFIFFDYGDSWSVILGAKQAVFLLMLFFSFGYARMLKRSAELKGTADEQAFRERMVQFNRINVGLAVIAVLLGSALNYY
ncbi:MAG: hypothetical protein ACKVRP_02810 [Bacteroidota bacterium]